MEISGKGYIDTHIHGAFGYDVSDGDLPDDDDLV